jgi:uncharacterized protein (DUF2336 family)
MCAALYDAGHEHDSLLQHLSGVQNLTATVIRFLPCLTWFTLPHIPPPSSPLATRFVGEVTRVDPTLLRSLVNSGYIPVVATVATDESGQALNVNADTAAGEVSSHYVVLVISAAAVASVPGSASVTWWCLRLCSAWVSMSLLMYYIVCCVCLQPLSMLR